MTAQVRPSGSATTAAAPGRAPNGQMPDSLARAIRRGRLTGRQVRELIAYNATRLGLGYDEAVEKARRGELSDTLPGRDIEMLVLLVEG